MTSLHVICGFGSPQSKVLATPTHFTPTVVDSLKIRKRLILKKCFRFQLLFNTFASASNLFYQSASAKKLLLPLLPLPNPWWNIPHPFHIPLIHGFHQKSTIILLIILGQTETVRIHKDFMQLLGDFKHLCTNR